MKKYFINSVLLILAMLVFTACNDDDEPAPEMTVNKTSLSFDIRGGELRFNVTSNVDWTISTEGDWYDLNDYSGKAGTTVITVTAHENTNFESNTGTVTIISSRGNITREISLTQKGKERVLKVDQTSYTFEPEGGEQSSVITSNVDWEISGTTDWLDVSQISGNGDATITIIAKMNNTSARKAILTLKDKEGKASPVGISINQKAFDLTVSPTSISFLGNQGTTATLTVTATGRWDLSGLPDWLHADAMSGTGNTTITLTTKTANETSLVRTATLTITSGGKSIKVEVRQEGIRVEDCKVILSDFVTLKTEVAFKVSFEKNVRTFYIGFMEAKEYGKMSEAQIVEYSESNFDLYSIDELGEILYSNMLSNIGDHDNPLKAGTEYVFFSFGYNSKKELGDITETRITTTSARTQEPFAYIGSCYYNSTNWFVQIASKEPNCWGYYAFLTEDVELIFAPDAIYAWYISQGIKNGLMEKYTGTGEDALVTINRSVGATGFGVGVQGYDSNNVLAGELDWNYGYVQSSMKKSRINSKKNMFYPITIKGRVLHIQTK